MSPMRQGWLANELAGIRALLLDVDDTIVDTRAAMVAAGSVALGALWPDQPADHPAMALRYYEDPERWFPRYASGTVRFDDMRIRRIQEVARAFGVTTPDDALTHYATAYDPAFRAAQRLFEDVPDLLDAARARGLPVALITNSAAAPTTLKLEALGLLDAFDAVVTTDTLGFGKPDPRMYLEACRRVDTPAPACVCVGDSLAWDVLGARDAGLRAVWLDRLALGTDEDVTRVTSLDELTSVLHAGATRATPDRFGATGDDR